MADARSRSSQLSLTSQSPEETRAYAACLTRSWAQDQKVSEPLPILLVGRPRRGQDRLRQGTGGRAGPRSRRRLKSHLCAGQSVCLPGRALPCIMWTSIGLSPSPSWRKWVSSSWAASGPCSWWSGATVSSMPWPSDRLEVSLSRLSEVGPEAEAHPDPGHGPGLDEQLKHWESAQ